MGWWRKYRNIQLYLTIYIQDNTYSLEDLGTYPGEYQTVKVFSPTGAIAERYSRHWYIVFLPCFRWYIHL